MCPRRISSRAHPSAPARRHAVSAPARRSVRGSIGGPATAATANAAEATSTPATPATTTASGGVRLRAPRPHPRAVLVPGHRHYHGTLERRAPPHRRRGARRVSKLHDGAARRHAAAPLRSDITMSIMPWRACVWARAGGWDGHT